MAAAYQATGDRSYSRLGIATNDDGDAQANQMQFTGVLRCFGHDLPALTTAQMCGVNKNRTHRLYGLLRQWGAR